MFSEIRKHKVGKNFFSENEVLSTSYKKLNFILSVFGIIGDFVINVLKFNLMIFLVVDLNKKK